MFILSQYVITDGDRFIYRNHSGKYVPTKSKPMADIYSKKQAEQIYNHSLPKALKSVFHVERYDTPLEKNSEVKQNDLDNNTEKVMESENIKRWIDKISNMNGLIKDLKERKEVLVNQLSELDKEKTDIEHYIEFKRFNAFQGYERSSELKVCMQNRRSIKNELNVINIILDNKFGEMVSSEIIHKIEGMDNRTYAPRVRHDLFDL